jgi:hypothetical protein
MSDVIRGQFHQRFTRSFYVSKLRAQLFCADILALYSTGVKAARRTLVKLTPGVQGNVRISLFYERRLIEINV